MRTYVSLHILSHCLSTKVRTYTYVCDSISSVPSNATCVMMHSNLLVMNVGYYHNILFTIALRSGPGKGFVKISALLDFE
jgi:hypothetical protein